MKILIVGDFCPQQRVARILEKGDYKSVLEEVKEVISCADYSVVNFECPIASTYNKPISKQGPTLKCSKDGVQAIKWAGFNCVTLANNHFRDYGDQGVMNTINVCKENGVDYVGGGEDIVEASKNLYKEINGETLAVINCCEHEFSIATDKKAGSNPLDPIQQFYAIKEARTKADYVLVIVHGGHEMWQLPNPRMKAIYRFFVDAGADAVVNHHQHCYSGYEIYRGKPIFYGLGNFCFDWPERQNSIWNEGYMVQINLRKNNDPAIIMFPYKQCNEQPCVMMMKDNQKQSFQDKILELNQIIKDDKKLRMAFDKLVKEKYNSFVPLFSPFKSRLAMGLVRRGLLPPLISKRKLLIIYNRISCESHRELLLNGINKIIQS